MYNIQYEKKIYAFWDLLKNIFNFINLFTF